MKHVNTNVLEDCLIASGVTISLMDIQTILGIIILSFQVILILIKLFKRVYNAVKNKNVDELTDAINDGKDELQNLSDNVSKK